MSDWGHLRERYENTGCRARRGMTPFRRFWE
jgi:hypothetical protein